MTKTRVIVFTRYPKPGKAKTRLIPELGSEGAAELSRQMTERTIVKGRLACERSDSSLEIRYEGGSEKKMRNWLGGGARFIPQGSGDLGQRMHRAFRHAFDQGVERVIIIGTDCPELNDGRIERALDFLIDHDLVIGPANDGGYYLIGLSKKAPELFSGITWGDNEVFDKTMGIAKSLKLKTYVMPPLSDIDRPEDLHIWDSILPTISVIIPTLNEEGNIGRTIDSIGAFNDVEVIVADGGSKDGTLRVASELDSKIVKAPAGRAKQMNVGARAAKGDIFLFLHADTILPSDYVWQIRRAFLDRRVIAGAFEFRFDGEGWPLRLLEMTTNFRSKKMQMPYGDQALFVREEAFWQIGAFPLMPLMEDFEFVRRIKRLGRIVTLPVPIITSSRRYKRRGPIKTTLFNQAIIAGYYLGLSPERLSRWYS
jgi:rSAM/selenodomain-associated transferase 2/rSAM/selenodomain-associated transferase 1